MKQEKSNNRKTQLQINRVKINKIKYLDYLTPYREIRIQN